MPTQHTSSEVYLRDGFVPFQDASLSIASSPVLYGLSVYTVFGAHWDEKNKKLRVFRLKDHYNRLLDSAKIMDFHTFADDWPWQKFQDTMLDLLKRNKVTQDSLVRVSVFIDEIFAGTKIHGLKNSLSAFVYPYTGLLPEKGAHLCVSSWQRTADNAIPSRAKVNGSYINASLMKNEALLNGYDEAIAVDQFGHVSESTVANIFLVRNGTLITPDAATDMLEGITRDSIIKLARHLDIKVERRAVDKSELYIAEELFLCGSSAKITPILSVDRRQIAAGKPGQITKKMIKYYDEVLHGRSPDFDNWLVVV